MGYYLPHQLVLIGCGKRIDSVQPEKNSIILLRIYLVYIYILEEEEEVLHPFFWLGGPNGPTERPDRTGQNEQLAPHLMYVDTSSAGACAKYTVRTDSGGEAQDSAWTQTRFFT